MSERTLNPLVGQFRRGGVPRDLRLVAAQGALPLTPGDLVELLELLARDTDGEVRSSATATLLGIPAEGLLPLLKDRQTTPEVLGWALENRPESALREVVLQNTTTADDAIEAIAGSLPAELAELVVINQVRLLRRTSLLEALEGNASLNNDQRRRLRELRETFRIGAVPAPVVAAAPPAAEEVEAPSEEPPAEVVEEGPISEAEALERYLTAEERGESQKISAVQRVFRLNTAEKVVLALKGNREERAILIRDPNRIVAVAVLGSPRMTESEIETVAAMRNVQDEILRIVGHHKEWTKRYGVISNLVKNPRTPLAIALNLVPRLNPRDMRALSSDRNVPEVVRRQAQRFVRQGPQK
jgi:hypothetical protein